jgi:hypothetical protein
LVSESHFGNGSPLNWSLRAPAEEKELIAKWNAGDYSAEGWVDKRASLQMRARDKLRFLVVCMVLALNGLAEYNAEKHEFASFINSVGP